MGRTILVWIVLTNNGPNSTGNVEFQNRPACEDAKQVMEQTANDPEYNWRQIKVFCFDRDGL